MGVDNLLIHKFPGNADATGMGTILENYCSKQMYKTEIIGNGGKQEVMSINDGVGNRVELVNNYDIKP